MSKVRTKADLEKQLSTLGYDPKTGKPLAKKKRASNPVKLFKITRANGKIAIVANRSAKKAIECWPVPPNITAPTAELIGVAKSKIKVGDIIFKEED